ASGIGRATALLYAQNGAKVVVCDMNEAGGNETAEMIKSFGGDAMWIPADVSKPEDCENLVTSTVKHFGRLDIACNNAGIAGEQSPMADMSIENWRHVMAVNLDSVFYCMKYQIAAMLKTGGGAIV